MAVYDILASRMALVILRLFQWACFAIVLGFTAYFTNEYDVGEHIIYALCISVISVTFYLVVLFLSLTKSQKGGWVCALLDMIFSYLYLVSVVFETQDYNYIPDGDTAEPRNLDNSSKKRAFEAFVFLSFFATALALVMQTITWMATRVAGDMESRRYREKIERPSVETA